MTHLGDVDNYVAEVRRVLESTTYEVELKDFEGTVAVVAHRSDFRVRWGAVRLHTTVTVLPVPEAVTRETLDAYLTASGQAARERLGRMPPGLQVGSAAVAVAVLPRMSSVAQEWAARPHGHKFASVGYPVAVGVAPAQVVEAERMRTGRVFRGFLREVVQEVVRAPLEAGGPGRRIG